MKAKTNIMAATIKSTVTGMLEKMGLVKDDDDVPPKEPSAEEIKTLREKYEKAGQGHVLAFYDDLMVPEKASLYEQLAGFDPNRINELAKKALHPSKDNETQPSIEPLPESATESLLDADKKQVTEWYNAGLKIISENKVAVVLMAGGQGTRLGSPEPKGCFNIGLPSEKSLFQIQGERILRLQHLAEKEFGVEQVIIPWYVMTSGPTRKPTEAFFQEHNYFGLSKENVIVFEQGVLPCISNDGKILMETKSKVGEARTEMRPSCTDLASRWLLRQMVTEASTKLS